MPELVTSRFVTSGMHCHSCSMLIQMNVGDMEGVETVRADLVNGITEVTYDASVASPESIIAEITKAGYGAELAE